jgi:type III pantothenate kinase
MSRSRKILTVDIGNTATKLTLFDGETALDTISSRSMTKEDVSRFVAEHHPDGAIYCCVGSDDANIAEALAAETSLQLVVLSHETPLPIDLVYATPDTLGQDRVAGAVGVAQKGRAALLVDAGTAATLDLVADGRFMGGNISAGLRLRLDALHRYTSHLPLVDSHGEAPVTGHDTITAIRSGALRGLAYEIIGTWQRLRTDYDNLQLILTGGDAPVLAPLLDDAGVEYSVIPDVVGIGLVRIFNFNNPL